MLDKAMVQNLGIMEANTSYIREIKRVLGWKR